MNPTTDDPRLTAYALDDPSLSADDRREVETLLAADADAAKLVADTRAVAAMLATGLRAELSLPPNDANRAFESVTPLTLRAREEKATALAWRGSFALAASVLIAAGSMLFVMGGYGMRAPKSVAQKPPVPITAVDGLDEAESHAGSGGVPNPTAPPAKPAAGPAGPLGNVTALNGNAFDPAKVQVHAMQGLPMTGDEAKAFKAAIDRAEVAKQRGVSAVASTPAPDSGKDTLTRFRNGTKPGGSGGIGSPDGNTGGIQFEKALSTASGAFGPKGGPGDPLSPFAGGGEGREKALQENLRQAQSPADFRGTNRFVAQDENPFVVAEGQNALSTFGVDVDTASYSIVRKFLTNGQRPPAGAIRLEELVNYFPYRDAPPTGDDPYKVTVELAECPWQPGHKLARIGLKAKPIDHDKRPASNLVFLVDVSGSMDEPNKLPWVKQSLAMLVEQLKENDRVGLVVYAGSTGVVLDSTTAAKKGEILSALDRLKAGGGTNGGAGIDLAYDMATKHFIEGGTNRVILCTDGDWNVGTTSTEALVQLIEAKRKSGVFLSVLGYGMGNLRDEMMVKLAGKGNGNYAYIDDLKEARKVLVEQLVGTLVTVAKDVKIQIEFNPARVAQYRLLGYEKRALAAKDFADDKKDAGEMGAGHVVTALYELVPTAVAATRKAEEPLKYQPKAEAPAVKAAGPAGEAFTVKLRHKLPASDVSTLRELPVSDVTKPYAEASEDFRFAAAVASFAMILRESPYQGNATFGLVAELANAAKTHDPGEYRAEFIKLIDAAKRVTGKP
jgi:Ca-activated chloride channel family protein